MQRLPVRVLHQGEIGFQHQFLTALGHETARGGIQDIGSLHRLEALLHLVPFIPGEQVLNRQPNKLLGFIG